MKLSLSRWRHRWLRHHWRTRTVATEFGTLDCRCAWWKRAAYLVSGQ